MLLWLKPELHARQVALLSPFIRDLILLDGASVCKDAPLVLPKQVGADVLQLTLEYCRFHRAAGRSDKARPACYTRLRRLTALCRSASCLTNGLSSWTRAGCASLRAQRTRSG